MVIGTVVCVTCGELNSGDILTKSKVPGECRACYRKRRAAYARKWRQEVGQTPEAKARHKEQKKQWLLDKRLSEGKPSRASYPRLPGESVADKHRRISREYMRKKYARARAVGLPYLATAAEIREAELLGYSPVVRAEPLELAYAGKLAAAKSIDDIRYRTVYVLLSRRRFFDLRLHVKGLMKLDHGVDARAVSELYYGRGTLWTKYDYAVRINTCIDRAAALPSAHPKYWAQLTAFHRAEVMRSAIDARLARLLGPPVNRPQRTQEATLETVRREVRTRRLALRGEHGR